MKHLLPLLFASCLPCLCFGQGYRMEVGAMGGGSFYMGDANVRLFNNMKPAYSVLLRYNLNRRFTLKADIGVAGISGSTTGQEGQFIESQALSFDRNLIDGTVAMEFNFYEFGAPSYSPGASRVSPYVMLGAGAVGYKTDKTKVAFCIPVGIGLKYKFADRFNLGLDLTYRMSLADDLDYATESKFQLTDPQGVSSAWNKNKDSYFVLKLYVSYDFMYIGSICYRQK